MENDKTEFEQEDEPGELEIDGDGETEDIEGVIRDAVAAVAEVQGNQKSKGAAADGEEVAEGRDDAEQIERLQQEIAELRDRSVRTLAELDNYRKRAEREQREIRRYALIEPMRAFLDVVDNLERALAANGSLEDLKAGVEMILHQMQDVLKQYGVQAVQAQGETFDPNLHEAVAREESAHIEAPEVIEELQRGYLLHERLLRPARVRVAVPAEAPKTAETRES